MVFERAKFMVGFAGAYRRSRRDGAEHEAALRAATDSVFARPRADIPEVVAALWRDPADECALTDGSWFGDGSLAITDAHVALLKQSRLGWDGAENGAPMLDPRRPYGREDLLTQLQEVFGTGAAEEMARRHVEMYFVLARALKHGALVPGRYPLGNIALSDVRAALRGYDGLSDDDLGVDADGYVSLTDDHLKLLRGIEIRWPSQYDCDDRLGAGEYPAAAADAKRPYGDFTHKEVDMARLLGELPAAPTVQSPGSLRSCPPPEPATFDPSPELALRLQRLHQQMLVAMQVFLEQMELAPATYALYPDHP